MPIKPIPETETRKKYYFRGCNTEEEAKFRYRKHSMELHPDRTHTDGAEFREMQLQYEACLKKIKEAQAAQPEQAPQEQEQPQQTEIVKTQKKRSQPKRRERNIAEELENGLRGLADFVSLFR